MITVLGIILGLYGLILALVAPWPVSAWGVGGLILGAIAGSSAGLAFGGDAINAAAPMGIVGFVVAATIAQIWHLTTTVQNLKTGREFSESKAPALWEILASLWTNVSGGESNPLDPREDSERRKPDAPPAPPPPPARPVNRPVQRQYDDRGKELRPARELDLSGDHEQDESRDRENTKLFMQLAQLVLLVGVVYIVYWASSHESEPDHWQANDTATESTTQDTQAESATDTQSDDDRPNYLSYRDVRRWMPDWEVPPLNPSAPEYDIDFVRRVERRRDFYMAAGYSEANAVVEAIHDLTEPEDPVSAPAVDPPAQESITESDRDATGGCELKSVMTDADYRACGITPPRN